VIHPRLFFYSQAGETVSRRTERPSRLKETKAQESPSKAIEPIKKAETDCTQSAIARQQLLQKGPRVKHVCRSASIVLGQPLAVFEPKPQAKPEPKPKPAPQTTSAPVKEVSPGMFYFEPKNVAST